MKREGKRKEENDREHHHHHRDIGGEGGNGICRFPIE